MYNETEKEKLDPEKAASMTVEELIKMYNELVDEHNRIAERCNWLLRVGGSALE